MPKASRHPRSVNPATGTATADAVAATRADSAENSPVSLLTSAGKSRLSRAGSSTFMVAIAMPSSAVPAQSQGRPGTDRITSPVASTPSADASVRSMPSRAAIGATSGENTAKHSSGRAIRAEASTALNPRSCCTSPSRGPTTVIPARRLAAMNMMPVSTRPRRTARVAVEVGTGAVAE